LTNITSEILSSVNPSDYFVSHHETITDANTGANPVPASYLPLTSPQTLYARIVNFATNEVTILAYNLVVDPTPFAPTMTLTNCSDVITSFPCWNLQSLEGAILQGQTAVSLTFYQTQADADAGSSPILNPSCYISPVAAPVQPPVFYRAQNTATGCYSIGIIELVTIDCGGSNCAAPSDIFTTSITQTSMVIGWTDANATGTYEVAINGTTISAYVTTNPYVLTGLSCGNAYNVSVRAVCSATEVSPWASTYATTLDCIQAGQPQDFTVCVDAPNQACFNLNDNDANVIGGLNPSDYSISYHSSQADAATNGNGLTSPYCVGVGNTPIFVRLTENATGDYQIMLFYINVTTSTNSPIQLQTISQCDDNLDGIITFDLTTLAIQLNTTNTLSYYTNSTDAETGQNAIATPASYDVNVQATSMPIFVRETIDGSCDVIYFTQIFTYSNCNLASSCNMANSLCNSLGVPFANTVGISGGGQAGCLGTTPNPTWFYLPVSGAGTINLQVNQITNTGIPVDVDYIVYGPFANPTTPCGNPNQLLSNIVSCSYSTAATEYPVIPNAQPGQYYLLMVTNFSNQAGTITISEVSNTQGQIDCTGFRMNAFLDSNSNGIKDSGETNFPLGQFHFEKNNDGVIHNVTSPSGIYNIYEMNPSSTYNLSYAVDSAYASMYSVTTPNYSNVSAAAGSGMTTYYFPVTIVQSYNDVAVTIVPLTAPRPGFTYMNKIVYSNLGNQTVNSGSLTFTKDSNVSITSVSQTGTVTTPTGFTFNYTNLLPFETREIFVTMQVPTVPTVNAGQYLVSSASIVPLTGDMVPENNSNSNSQMVINSYDPNDKMEAHGERILHSSFTSNDYLYYTIRFENTGSASAINVRVNDYLDSKLDENSVKMVSASHSYTMDRVGNNLNWKFDNIELPVSIAETNIGKGYVTFKVKPKSGYAIGDIIPNTASIFFDFNPAIVTNTFNTEFVSSLNVSQFENGDFVFYPNPTSGNVTVSVKDTAHTIASIVVYDVLSKTIFAQKTTDVTSQVIDLSSVNSGMYFIEVTTDNNVKVVKKLMVK